ncbi:hypothetical protein JAAARDRAFT_34557 [Jaapia argillacea MUCL 33604]|uniref:DUF6593 domain-containing protein n=1 Tax=Jaapia argillacea MUCL 33604 TaxID=933084 RepID=A0A067PVF1_9AGAM|nr:hypothetical protein JAAARDRAFT_34557 [Jaapia argillacea MUCL 33604]
MDSQVTLVDHPPAGSTVLVLDKDSMKNTHVSLGSSGMETEPLYTVSSNTSGDRTEVRSAYSDIPVAVITRGTILPDKISIRGGEKMKLSKWLITKGVSHFPITFAVDGKDYTWNINIVRQLTLYASEDLTTPLAWFVKSKKRVIDGTPTILPAYFVLKSDVDHIRDELVAAREDAGKA